MRNGIDMELVMVYMRWWAKVISLPSRFLAEDDLSISRCSKSGGSERKDMDIESSTFFGLGIRFFYSFSRVILMNSLSLCDDWGFTTTGYATFFFFLAAFF